jgi:ribose-phosphate pyrophosphokinase
VQVIGELDGKRAVLVDDMIDTGGSVVSAAEMVAARGASEIYVYATHAILSGDAVARLGASTARQVVVTDTIPMPPEKCGPNMRLLSIAPVLADAVRRVHGNADAVRRVHGNISVSHLYDRYWEDDKK